jgi:integrase
LIIVHGSVHEYDLSMTRAAAKRRTQGSIRQRGRSYQVRVYAGVDPLTNRVIYLTETASDEKEAQRVLRRLLTQVDEQRHARTKATLSQALDSWLKVHEAEANTLAGYEANARRYIKPVLGDVAIGKITTHMLEEFYAQLRRCRSRCNGRSSIEHRVDGQHECRIVRHKRPPGRPPTSGYPPHDCATTGCRVIECRPHVCQPLSPAMIRQIHITVSAALAAAVRWDWIKTNPADTARTPRLPVPQPEPPSSKEAARIIAAAWEQDDGWGTLVWLTMVTGMRRAELLALRWYDVDLDGAVLEIRRNYVRARRQGVEKDTKTHRMRRIALDSETIDVLRAHRDRYEAAARAVAIEPADDAFLFSYDALHTRPCSPHGVSHRYSLMCERLGIDSHLHALRHYSATELLAAGVDLRTVAGRLGHAGGGTTTLRVYAAWVTESDRRAAEILGGRMKRPGGSS